MSTPNLSFAKSEVLAARARQLMPGGVSSPVRAFKKIGGDPVFMSSGSGAYVTDEDGNRYLDFCMAWGPLILGHAHPAVIEAVQKSARDGLAFGTCHRHESQLAELVLEAFAPMERVRFVVSGTEAVLTATRLARAATKRSRILKFAGCYHGHVDSLLVKAGSGLVADGLADSEGVPSGTAAQTLVINLGDEAALIEVFARHGSEIAAAIVEPLPANNGLLVQSQSWLKKLRALTEQHGALLIFDEVITGFRFGFHGYGALCGVQPDLVTLGKIVGGGLPVGAIVGTEKLMNQLAPMGGVYQAGTMAGNPVALASGIATLTELKKGSGYTHLQTLSDALVEKMKTHSLAKQARLVIVGSIVWPYFDTNSSLPKEASEISVEAVQRYHQSYRQWLNRGVYLPPSGYEVSFLTAAHTESDLDVLLTVLSQ